MTPKKIENLRKLVCARHLEAHAVNSVEWAAIVKLCIIIYYCLKNRDRHPSFERIIRSHVFNSK